MGNPQRPCGLRGHHRWVPHTRASSHTRARTRTHTQYTTLRARAHTLTHTAASGPPVSPILLLSSPKRRWAQRGASVGALDAARRTPRQLALKAGYIDLADLLDDFAERDHRQPFHQHTSPAAVGRPAPPPARAPSGSAAGPGRGAPPAQLSGGDSLWDRLSPAGAEAAKVAVDFASLKSAADEVSAGQRLAGEELQRLRAELGDNLAAWQVSTTPQTLRPAPYTLTPVLRLERGWRCGSHP